MKLSVVINSLLMKMLHGNNDENIYLSCINTDSGEINVQIEAGGENCRALVDLDSAATQVSTAWFKDAAPDEIVLPHFRHIVNVKVTAIAVNITSASKQICAKLGLRVPESKPKIVEEKESEEKSIAQQLWPDKHHFYVRIQPESAGLITIIFGPDLQEKYSAQTVDQPQATATISETKVKFELKIDATIGIKLPSLIASKLHEKLKSEGSNKEFICRETLVPSVISIELGEGINFNINSELYVVKIPYSKKCKLRENDKNVLVIGLLAAAELSVGYEYKHGKRYVTKYTKLKASELQGEK